jgi:hypothetical protein
VDSYKVRWFDSNGRRQVSVVSYTEVLAYERAMEIMDKKEGTQARVLALKPGRTGWRNIREVLVGPKVTWWVSVSPTNTLSMLSDEALLETLNTTRGLARRLRVGPEKLPAVGQMWKYDLMGLYAYGMLISMELRNKRLHELDAFWEFNGPAKEMAERAEGQFRLPPWHDDEHVHRSHVVHLDRHDMWKDDVDIPELVHSDDEFLPMLWPVMVSENEYELRVNKADKEALAIDDLYLPDEIASRVTNLD